MDTPAILAVVDAGDDVLLATLAWRRIAGLIATGAHVETSIVRAAPSLAATLRHAGITVHASPAAPGDDWHCVRDLATCARAAHADAIYALGPSAAARAALAGPLAGVPVVLHPWTAPRHDELAAAKLAGSTMIVSTAHCALRAAAVGVDAVHVRPPTCPVWPDRGSTGRVVGWFGDGRNAAAPRVFGAIAAGAPRPEGVRYAMTFVGTMAGGRTWAGATVRAEACWHAGLLDGHAVFVHTGGDDSAPTALIDALASPLPVVLPANGYAHALAERDGVYAYVPGDPGDLERAIGAALASPDVAPAPASIDACARRVLAVLADAVAHRRALAPASAA